VKEKKQLGMGRRNNGNVSMDLYNRANKMQGKTKKNQEERLKNILRMHDNNLKRGAGIAHKNRVL